MDGAHKKSEMVVFALLSRHLLRYNPLPKMMVCWAAGDDAFVGMYSEM